MSMGEIYVIMKPDYKKYALEAWSTNPYLINVYFNNFILTHKGSMINTYHIRDELMIKNLYNIKDECSARLEDFAECELMSHSSFDKRLYAVFKSKYKDSFLTNYKDYDTTIAFHIKDLCISSFLSAVPIVKYFDNYDNLLTILFNGYNSILSQNYDMDMVYIWAYLLNKDNLGFISAFHKDIIPIDTAFIFGGN